MTVKQQKYLAGVIEGKSKMQSALDAGYSESTASTAGQNIESPLFMSTMEKAFDAEGITIKYLVDQLMEGFKAEKVIASWADLSPDYETRLKYLMLSFKLLKYL